jgi:LuxR family maltose regulon positive regulatory protein
VQEGQPIAEALVILLKRNLLGAVQPGYVENILAAFSRSQPSVKMDKQLGLIEPLTERELEVLRLLAQGLKYAEIAERLVVSVNTVRYHVKGIYGKLGVEKLTKAIEKARQLNLL